MTRLNYSNLPPEAQLAIQKMTGLGPEELEGNDKSKIPEAAKETGYNPMDKTTPGQTDYWLACDKGMRFIKHKPGSFWSVFLGILAFIFVILGIVFLIATLATH